MEVIIKPDAAAVSKEVALYFEDQLEANPASVFCFPSGDATAAIYRELVMMCRAELLDFKRARAFHVDEFVGIAGTHPGSSRAGLREQLFSHIDLLPENVQGINGIAPDIAAHCREYEEAIRRAGGIDLQLLDLGVEGRIGFNEPGSSLASRTRIKTQTRESTAENARLFGSEAAVPRHVVTMGVGTIMEARQVVIVALGGAKAAAVAATVEGPITADVPASILQMHPACALLVDEAAATALRRADYYRWAYQNKPDWQRL